MFYNLLEMGNLIMIKSISWMGHWFLKQHNVKLGGHFSTKWWNTEWLDKRRWILRDIFALTININFIFFYGATTTFIFGHNTRNRYLIPSPSLQWHHVSEMASQFTGKVTFCSTVYADIIKHQSLYYWPFVRESTGDRWIPLTKDK